MVETIDIEKALMETNIIILKDQDIQESEIILGSGTFGLVRKGMFGDKPVAIKELVFNENEVTPDEVVKDILNELKAFSIVEKLHPAIVKFYGVWKQSSKIKFIFELINGKDLSNIYKDLTDKQKLEIVIQICDVLGVLHASKLIHRDIKPNNVMIENDTGKVRVIDFGTVKIAKNENTFTVNQKGTDNYMSPELIRIIEFEGDEDSDTCHFSVSPKVDVWAVGCVISEIFSGYIPWTNSFGKNPMKIRNALKKKIEFPIPQEITNPAIQNLIKSATAADLEQRCSIVELKELCIKVLSELS